ncbi:MAG: excinuclease ABC subunit UvrA [Helicobacteraceae bacterium]|jgi:excinuclease ABC subunit A|nr:excinuclease ABC subunit UvrA [Helicobacteraceae bacterium]
MTDHIKVIGARENNLKNISLALPKNQFIVMTGISGSGKSTLAFKTLYAEGQRRYIESLSSYARMFLDRVGKPDVDKIDGLTPAIAIDQKTTSKNPRSTVGTITEIYDYLRLLYARVGEQHCHLCGKPISQMSASDIIGEVLKLPEGAKAIITAPIVKEKKGTFNDLLESLRHKGFVRAQIDGVTARLDEEIDLAKNKKHTIKAVVDRVVIKDENKDRAASAVERALQEGFGQVEVEVENAAELGCADRLHYSEHLACFDCKVSFDPLEPLMFSFNSPKGACAACDGLGTRYAINQAKVIDPAQSIANGAVRIFFKNGYYDKFLQAFCATENINTRVPFEALSEREQGAILHGTPEIVRFNWKYHPIEKAWQGVLSVSADIFKESGEIGDYFVEKTCDRCEGHRLKAESLAVKVAGIGIADAIDMPIEDAEKFFANDANFSYLSEQKRAILTPILKEIRERLFFLVDVGLGYLTLGRSAQTISGGENQRIRIASQIGSGLTGVMYVLDEPSIGLHERDTMKLIRTLKSLRDRGNTVIVVEHDKETMRSADFIVDIGPGAGKFGGEVVFMGAPSEILAANTETAEYLSGKKRIDHAKNREQKEFLEIKNVTINNIFDLSVKIPLANFVCVTGVSGSGKSSLILQTLLPVAKELLNHAHKIKKVQGVTIEGMEHLDKVIYLDQSPIGRTPRSIPATYIGLMDDLRNLFTETKESKLRGYTASRFSFNVKGGRCERCQGDGEIKIEMHFLPDIMVKCDACRGSRFNDQTLEIKYRGKTIADVLSMSVDEAVEFFAAHPKISQKVQTLKNVGLGYILLGQNGVTLSGGEAQRIKLSKELARSDTGRTLYVLDEPTTGLHFADVDRLVRVLQRLTDLGNSVVVIEHNLDVVKNADYVIDLGPEGGRGGGKVIAEGSPAKLAANFRKSGSFTGEFLAQELAEYAK